MTRRGLKLPDRRRVPDFPDWLRQVSPTWIWDWPHLSLIQQHLHKVTIGETKRLMLFLPPRHGKSEMTTIRYPIWRMERDPHLRVIVGAYSQFYANKFGRKSRRIAEERMTLSKERTAVDDWETPEGGGYRSIGVGAGITGQGGDLILIDDPVKNREEAESEAYRERCWTWYTDDLWTRKEPNAAIILIMTRWHQDDLAGRLLEAAHSDGEQWTVVNLPALAEENDPLGREEGAALCPERYDEEALQAAKNVLGNYSFSALYQQRPGDREGNLFKRHWFEFVNATPAVADRVRWWDKAATEGDGDYTVGLLMAKTYEGLYYVEDVVRGQWSSGKRDQIIKSTAEMDKARYGGRVQVWTEQEPGSGGKESAEATVRLLTGHSVRYERSTGDKETRADPLAAQCEAGNVKILKAPWNASYLDELCAFPTGKHDDQVDASSGAFNKLALPIPGSPVVGGQRAVVGQYKVR